MKENNPNYKFTTIKGDRFYYQEEEGKRQKCLEVLGLGANATFKEIKSAYRQISKETHKNSVCVDRETYEAATEAYKFLSDPETKERHEQKTRVIIKKIGKNWFLCTGDGRPFSSPYDEIYEHGPKRFSAYRQGKAYLLNEKGEELKGPFIRITQRDDMIYGIKREMVWNGSRTSFRYEETEEALN